MLKTIYCVLAILGTVIPYSQFILFLQQNGFDLQRFLQLLFVNPVSSLFGWDFIFTTLTLWVFVFVEGSRQGMKNLWVYIVTNLTVGVSLALPLFLWMRQQHIEKRQIETSTLAQS